MISYHYAFFQNSPVNLQMDLLETEFSFLVKIVFL